MKNKNKTFIYFLLSVISFAAFSCSFLLMAFGTDSATGKTTVFTYVAGAVFWFFLMTGIITQIMLSKSLGFKSQKKSMSKKIGALIFFSNKYAVIADIALVISVAGFVLSMIFAEGSNLICYIFAFVLMLSFCMHCIFNGKKFALLLKGQKKAGIKIEEKENS